MLRAADARHAAPSGRPARGRWLAAAAAVVLTSCAGPVARSGAGASPGATPVATRVALCRSANPPPLSVAGPESPIIGGELQAVAAVNTADAWAVGDTNLATSLIIHSDRGAWREVRTPIRHGGFDGVAATSAADAWAVGSGPAPLIEHWNGSAWALVPVPGADGMALYGVAALSATSAWAVGEAHYGGTAVILRWDGTEWLRLASPATGAGSAQLLGVAATSATDAWAVGNAGRAALIEHWDGARWTVVPSPAIPRGATLAGVAATAPANAWAVGTLASGGALIEHWNGHAWALTPSPSLGQFGQLHGVTALSPGSAWAVGGTLCAGRGGLRTVIEHWNGRDWRLVPSPAAGMLTGVSAASDSSAWAVGFLSAGGSAVLEHWDGTAWTWPEGLCGSPTGAGCIAGTESTTPAR